MAAPVQSRFPQSTIRSSTPSWQEAMSYWNAGRPFVATPGAMERRLTMMLDALVPLVLAHGSTSLADHLRASIRQRGRLKLTEVTFRMATAAAQLAALPPRADQAISTWLCPRAAERREHRDARRTRAFCNGRGGSWWRSIPRIGPERARAIVS